MKKTYAKLIILSTLLSLVACNSLASSSKSESSSFIDSSSKEVSSETKSSISSKSETTSSSKEEKSSSSLKSSSSSSSSNQGFVNDELSTEAGLTVKFKANGGRIDKITWQGKQIAKDGFVVGRCANRIAGGTFSIDGTTYSVTKNDGNNSLHGGGRSWQGPFANATWNKVEQTASSITYSIHSPDGEEGYPGNMDMTVKYTLSQDGDLDIEYSATSDKDTLCNPTNHLFIAINGNNSYSNLKLFIDADKYTPLKNSLPTGEIASVNGTQFDYSTEKAFDGSKNYDDNYVLNGEGYRHVASLKGTSLAVLVSTDRPGLQLYKDGNGSICLESQMFPDAINHDNFESPILRKNTNFYSKTTYSFVAIDGGN